MEFFDILVFVLLAVAVVGLSYQNATFAATLEGFEDGATVYMFYSLTSVIPGKKCRQNYRLFKENRHYMQLWSKFRQYLLNTGRGGVEVKSVNVDESPEYVAEFDLSHTPQIVIAGGGRGDSVFPVPKGHLPSLNELISFYESVEGSGTKNLQNYSDAVVYLYVPNCYDCRTYFSEWQEFKKELTALYPDISVFEVDVTKNAQYDKYIYRFQGSAYPLVLTKNAGNITVNDLVELYGGFSYDNLFTLVDETFFRVDNSTESEAVAQTADDLPNTDDETIADWGARQGTTAAPRARQGNPAAPPRARQGTPAAPPRAPDDLTVNIEQETVDSANVLDDVLTEDDIFYTEEPVVPETQQPSTVENATLGLQEILNRRMPGLRTGANGVNGVNGVNGANGAMWANEALS